MLKTVIGVMGPGEGATGEDSERAMTLGRLIAKEGWVLLSGGRDQGVMDAVNRGAKQAGGLTIGILPSDDTARVSDGVDIAIVTGMGSARNNINVLSSSAVIACGMGAGTASEIALALKARKPVVLLTRDEKGLAFFKSLGEEFIHPASSPEEAIAICRRLVAE